MSPRLWGTPGDCRGLQGTRWGNGFGGESSPGNGSRAPSLFSRNHGRGFDSRRLHQRKRTAFALMYRTAVIGVGCSALRAPIAAALSTRRARVPRSIGFDRECTNLFLSRRSRDEFAASSRHRKGAGICQNRLRPRLCRSTWRVDRPAGCAGTRIATMRIVDR